MGEKMGGGYSRRERGERVNRGWWGTRRRRRDGDNFRDKCLGETVCVCLKKDRDQWLGVKQP